MSGYNRLEQTAGVLLDRFPRLKGVAETAYQRTNYHLFARGFEYDLHEDAKLYAIEDTFELEQTKSPRFVGFYDVQPWNESVDRYLVHEPSSADDEASIVVLSEDSARTVSKTAAWNYQQGSRTQWHPTREETVVFNDLEDGSPVCRIAALDGTVIKTYPSPVAAMHPHAEEFLSVDYRRLDRNSPAYGYSTADKRATPEEHPSPAKDGIFRITSETSSLVVSFESLIDWANTSVPRENHYLHHLLYAPDGDRFVFLHRWMDGSKRHTRLFFVDPTGNLKLLLENPYLSHFCWLDNDRLFLWGGSDDYGRGYHILDVTSGNLQYVDALDGYGDGHPSVSPDGRWIATDTYPDRARKRHLMLYDLETERVVTLGSFHAPFGYDGGNRCDLHPRWSPDGRLVSIDSTYDGTRRSYAIDVREIVS